MLRNMSLLFLFACVAIVKGSRKAMKLLGKNTHGLNIFNGEAVSDYASSTLPAPSVPQMRVKDCDDIDSVGTQGEAITAETSRDKCLVTDNQFHNFFYVTSGLVEPNDELELNDVGVQFSRVGTWTLEMSTDTTMRQVVDPYDTGLGGIRVNPNWPINGIKLGDYEQIKGKMYIRCGVNSEAGTNDDDGPEITQLRLKVRRGIPNAVYTLWEMAVANGGPIVGPPIMPNAIITDDWGNGEGTWHLPYCPLDTDMATTEGDTGGRIISYILANHFDFSIKGGIPDFGQFKPASASGGVISADVLDFFVYGVQTE